ncbi:MAG: glycogen synthase, partial [Candidatus Margulisbacteria bacterium]|nr:glycogen synthase [Candidatus Margulisiibacteriota bacterium]
GTDIPVELVQYDPMFDRPGLYGENGVDYIDNAARFILFCRATLEALKATKFRPDILHSNDWQTAMVNPMLQTLYQNSDFFRGTKTVYTIHNLEFLGLFNAACLGLAHLGKEHFNLERLEFYGDISFAKGGLAYADKINTVSRTYRNETLTPAFGCGLVGLLGLRQADYVGILNGIDSSRRDPKINPVLPANYEASDLSGKATCKATVQQEFNLPIAAEIPLLGFSGRLSNQKGLDLIIDNIKTLMGFPLQIIFLGAGDPYYYQLLQNLRAAYPQKLGLVLSYNEILSQHLKAGSDFFLMPSRTEPCGLAQMVAMGFGTPPIVMRTGGLADTVIDYSEQESGNGLVFNDFSSTAFINAIQRALDIFKNKAQFLALQQNAMNSDFPWDTSAAAYENLYHAALQAVKSGLQS